MEVLENKYNMNTLEKEKQLRKTIGSRRRANNRYNGLVSRIKYYENNRKNKNYLNIKLKISRKEFIEWFMKNDFEGCSVDRIDKNGDYELSNMQLIPLVENIRKDKVKEKNGYCICYVCNENKPIEMFAIDKRRVNGHSTICKKCDSNRKKRNSTGNN